MPIETLPLDRRVFLNNTAKAAAKVTAAAVVGGGTAYGALTSFVAGEERKLDNPRREVHAPTQKRVTAEDLVTGSTTAGAASGLNIGTRIAKDNRDLLLLGASLRLAHDLSRSENEFEEAIEQIKEQITSLVPEQQLQWSYKKLKANEQSREPLSLTELTQLDLNTVCKGGGLGALMGAFFLSPLGSFDIADNPSLDRVNLKLLNDAIPVIAGVTAGVGAMNAHTFFDDERSQRNSKLLSLARDFAKKVASEGSTASTELKAKAEDLMTAIDQRNGVQSKHKGK